MLPKTLAWYPKDFGMANVIPYSTIYYTIEHRTINHIARKFITDKGNKIPSRYGFIYIVMEFNLQLIYFICKSISGQDDLNQSQATKVTT